MLYTIKVRELLLNKWIENKIKIENVIILIYFNIYLLSIDILTLKTFQKILKLTIIIRTITGRKNQKFSAKYKSAMHTFSDCLQGFKNQKKKIKQFL